jgi:hypothetical protein
MEQPNKVTMHLLLKNVFSDVKFLNPKAERRGTQHSCEEEGAAWERPCQS